MSTFSKFLGQFEIYELIKKMFDVFYFAGSILNPVSMKIKLLNGIKCKSSSN